MKTNEFSVFRICMNGLDYGDSIDDTSEHCLKRIDIWKEKQTTVFLDYRSTRIYLYVLEGAHFGFNIEKILNNNMTRVYQNNDI